MWPNISSKWTHANQKIDNTQLPVTCACVSNTKYSHHSQQFFSMITSCSVSIHSTLFMLRIFSYITTIKNWNLTFDFLTWGIKKNVSTKADDIKNDTETERILANSPNRMPDHEVENSFSNSATSVEIARQIRAVTDILTPQLEHRTNAWTQRWAIF